jgi:glucuronyl/N-acetylglucosaminyl transferase EXT1
MYQFTIGSSIAHRLQDMRDVDECTADELRYNNYDYNELLMNSTFALVPRGRRLATFRLLEVFDFDHVDALMPAYHPLQSMRFGAIPVIFADGYVLPFSELLDWTSFSLTLPEQLWHRTENILRAIPSWKVGNPYAYILLRSFFVFVFVFVFL